MTINIYFHEKNSLRVVFVEQNERFIRLWRLSFWPL